MLVHQRVSQFCWIIRQLLLGTLGTQLSFANDVRVVMPYSLLGLHEDEHHHWGEERIYELKMAWRNQLNPRIRTFCSMVPMLSYVFVQCVCLHRHEEINCNICKSISRWLPLNTAHGNILPEICFFLGRELYHQASWQCLYICIHIHLRICVYIYICTYELHMIFVHIYIHIFLECPTIRHLLGLL